MQPLCLKRRQKAQFLQGTPRGTRRKKISGGGKKEKNPHGKQSKKKPETRRVS
jgi:hypothetical protein